MEYGHRVIYELVIEIVVARSFATFVVLGLKQNTNTWNVWHWDSITVNYQTLIIFLELLNSICINTHGVHFTCKHFSNVLRNNCKCLLLFSFIFANRFSSLYVYHHPFLSQWLLMVITINFVRNIYCISIYIWCLRYDVLISFLNVPQIFHSMSSKVLYFKKFACISIIPWERLFGM